MGFPSVAVNLLMHRTQTHPHPSPPLEGEGAKQDKEVLRLRDISFVDVATLLARYDLHLERVADDAPIPGSYWGDCEAGLIGATVHARDYTPVHSLLPEACHQLGRASCRDSVCQYV